MRKRKEMPRLSPLENAAMQVVWQREAVRAEDVRIALQAEHDLKDSTVRTLLRRLEGKGVLEHSLEGRAFTYRAKIEPEQLAARAVQGIANRFCKGSISSLLLGMADDSQISAAELRRLADQIDMAQEAEGKRSTQSANKKTKPGKLRRT